ncbi:hypothetical protein CASFOL_020961 [Castilleja foliolosa]|uniref:Sieve element occlusion C-terminal domain-containing protein n=1 Tax=Castilleja foliolosa TaxID=1961234 RepID=A0ABD3D5D5_9LAMI
MSSCEGSFVDRIDLSEVVGTHDPDDRHLDSEMLLNLLQTTFCFVADDVLDAKHDEIAISDIDFTGSKEPISLIMYKISSEPNPNRKVIAAWGIYSLGTKLNSLCKELREYADKSQGQIETRLYDKLLHMFKENKDDNNQLTLKTLFASQNKFPFKNASSDKKCDIQELKNKVVILLISKPELFPIDKIFFLSQQTRYHHSNQTKPEEKYAIIWVPIIQTSSEWTHADKATFELVSNSLPWLSIRRPWLLNLTVINYMKQEWEFEKDPIMVVLDENGLVSNSNALDMVWIWGPTAFPFSASREKELWGEENWDLHLIINGINTLSSAWVDEGKNLCIFGSDNLDWIREINATIKKINSFGVQLELLYVGCKNPSEKNVNTIINIIEQEDLCNSLTLNKINLFWFRLEAIKKSIGRQNPISFRLYKISTEVSELLEMKSDQDWALIGGGLSTDVIKIDREKTKEFIDLFPLWSRNVARMGLVDGIRSAFEAQNFGDEKKCYESEMIPFEEGLIEDTMVCGSCKGYVEKFVLYKCDDE